MPAGQIPRGHHQREQERQPPGWHLPERLREGGRAHTHQGGGEAGGSPDTLPWDGGSGAGSRVWGTPRARPQSLVSAASQIITKEIEANEWKKKYEESRQEVLEMR